MATALDSDPLSAAIVALLDEPAVRGKWQGTPTELLTALRRHVTDDGARSGSWPRAANTLSNRLRRLKPALAKIGVMLEQRRGGARSWTVERVPDRPSSSSSSTMSENDIVDDVGHDDVGGTTNGSRHGYPPEWDTV
jgi:hypothetical protein